MTDISPNTNSFWRPETLGVVAIALFLRLTVFFLGPCQDESRVMIDEDSARYVVLAENLVTFQSFGKSKEDGIMHRAIERLRAANGTLAPADSNGLRPDGFRTPGYPLFLAGCRLITRDLRVPIFLQCLLGSLLAGCVCEVARRFSIKTKISYALGLIWAIHPGLIVSDNGIMTESLFNAVSVGAVTVTTISRSLRGIIVAGLLIGIAGIIRPLGLVFLPATVMLAWPNQTRRWLAIFILTSLATVPSIGWAARNASVGYGYRVTTVGDLNHLFYTAAYAISEEQGEDWLNSWEDRVIEFETKLSGRLELQENVFSASRTLAFEEMEARPNIVAKVLLKSWSKLLVDHSASAGAHVLGMHYRPSGLFSRFILQNDDAAKKPGLMSFLIVLAWVGLNSIITLLAIVGQFRWLLCRDYRLFLIVGITVGLFLVATGAVGLERFRLPVMLMLLLAAGAAWGKQKIVTQV